MGSGTTLFECEALHRKFIGFDINSPLLEDVNQQMFGSYRGCYFIHPYDICDKTNVSELVEKDLVAFNHNAVDMILSHPPYLDVIRFTEEKSDLSHISDITQFTDLYIQAVSNVWPYLTKKGYFILVIGDVYRKGEVVPLGFTLMNAIKQNFKCLLKGIVVKDMVGNRAKIGQEKLWRYRAMKWGTFLFKHEYIFVFRKK